MRLSSLKVQNLVSARTVPYVTLYYFWCFFFKNDRLLLISLPKEHQSILLPEILDRIGYARPRVLTFLI